MPFVGIVSRLFPTFCAGVLVHGAADLNHIASPVELLVCTRIALVGMVGAHAN